MSRTKNKATKMMAGESMEKKVLIAEIGVAAESELFAKADALINCIHHAACLERLKVIPVKDGKKWIKFHRDNAWNALAKATLAAFKTGDGTIFHAMAEAVKLHSKPIDPRQAFVFTQIGAAEAFRLPLPTIPQLMVALEKLGLGTDRRSLRRIVEEYGERKLPNRKPGRPKK